ncbi:hypothetical protein A3J78_01125 [Candidatus Beckwithbacteria bacterium RBG_13_35_6]|uniref:Uncharacterized protein n=1 Tax=Candidatus Beckwithbacteria bacterium RBG_13_35_6 TaxID=1797456 RepID=A0A1F5DDS7_9BACT|nr:MAG: hypothetical protein A3J78_01125 [Candidatus Beckwithbacteria bacterium RBG_13_35_6]
MSIAEVFSDAIISWADKVGDRGAAAIYETLDPQAKQFAETIWESLSDFNFATDIKMAVADRVAETTIGLRPIIFGIEEDPTAFLVKVLVELTGCQLDELIVEA